MLLNTHTGCERVINYIMGFSRGKQGRVPQAGPNMAWESRGKEGVLPLIRGWQEVKVPTGVQSLV